MTIFGDRAFTGVHMNRPSSNDWCLYIGKADSDTDTQGKPLWGHSEKVAIYEPRRKVSKETKAANTLILDF